MLPQYSILIISLLILLGEFFQMKFKYETRRLSLKLLKPSAKYARQALDFYNRNRAVFERYEALRPKDFYTEGYQKAMLEHDYNLAIHSKCFRFWVFTKNDLARIIGSICFYDIIQPVYGRCETGYKFDERYWHRGLAKEAMELGITLMFYEVGLHRIEAYAMKDNTASIRLLDSLGFQYEGTCRQYARIRGRWEDHLLYSLIR